ncbi:MAG: hypothetical protein U0325_31295 [Polyangiales bacterium]
MRVRPAGATSTRTAPSTLNGIDARKVEAFLQATVDLNTSINDVSTNLITLCRNIGNAIGVPTTAYVPMTAGEAQVTTTCRPVYTEMQAIIRAAVPTNAPHDHRAALDRATSTSLLRGALQRPVHGVGHRGGSAVQRTGRGAVHRLVRGLLHRHVLGHVLADERLAVRGLVRRQLHGRVPRGVLRGEQPALRRPVERDDQRAVLRRV